MTKILFSTSILLHTVWIVFDRAHNHYEIYSKKHQFCVPIKEKCSL